MKSLIIAALVFFIAPALNSQNLLNQVKNQVNTVVGGSSQGSSLSNDEVIRGLKEALNVGTNNATGKASRLDGFYKNSIIKIPFPPEARAVESAAKQFGMTKQVDNFVKTMNRAAEEASKEAAPIFINAVKGMTISDGLTILRGGDGAATNFLKGRTQAELTSKFSPIVKRAINKVQLTKYWNPIVSKYNRIPGVRRQNPDLDKYVTEKALAGLFRLIADEENKIRKDPAARVSDILRKVFG
ncbi:MAG: DUF4197 domain-containing protein [Bacteroidia bacterium]